MPQAPTSTTRFGLFDVLTFRVLFSWNIRRLGGFGLPRAGIDRKARGINRVNWSTEASACPTSPMELGRTGTLVHEMAAMVNDHISLFVNVSKQEDVNSALTPLDRYPPMHANRR
jgi:hypothetical protein